MSITATTTEQLRRKQNEDGLVLQGCGGEAQEWLDGINDLLTKEGILLNGSKFEKCESFQHKGITSLYFPFEGVELNAGKFAMWRLQTHGTFGGTWLSDYVPNSLGGFLKEQKKPDCPLIGQDGNIFNLICIAARTLRRNGMSEQAKEMTERITQTAGNYYKALDIIGEYVNITSVDDGEDEDEDEDEDYGEDDEEEEGCETREEVSENVGSGIEMT